MTRRQESRPRSMLAVMLAALALGVSSCAASNEIKEREMVSYPLAVLPPENQAIKDPFTGTDLLFVTTSPHSDRALYFHQRSWLADESVLLFSSDRPQGGLMGYIFATGELVRVTTPQGALGRVVAARDRNSILGHRGREILELALEIEPSRDPGKTPSRVVAAERVICTLPANVTLITLLTENADGSLLGAGARWQDTDETGVITIDVRTGELREVCRVAFGSSHVLFSRGSPQLLSFNGERYRLMLVDVREGKPWVLYPHLDGELVTHEAWWLNDQMLFVGGFREKESHVKIIDAHTGVVRIVGAGAWVPWEGNGDDSSLQPREGDGDDVLNRWNWWEATGDEAGRFVVADNWFGDVVLFDAQTTRMYRLTLGHRRYGQRGKEQPTASWDRSGKRVVFTSQMLGRADVCVATIPDTWPWPPPPADEGLVVTKGVVKDRRGE